MNNQEYTGWEDGDLVTLSNFFHDLETKGFQLPDDLENAWTWITEEMRRRNLKDKMD